jgi:hypothetical protein
VANLHTVQEMQNVDRRQMALSMFEDARDDAMKALLELKNFTDSNLEVILFSGKFCLTPITQKQKTLFIVFGHLPDSSLQFDTNYTNHQKTKQVKGTPSIRYLTA